MNKKKLIFISEVPLSKKIFDSWYIEDLFKIFKKKLEYWDISNFRYKNNKDPNQLKYKYVKKFKNIEQINIELNKNKNFEKIVISLIPVGYEGDRLLKIFQKYDCYLIHIVWGYMPNDDLQLFQKIKKRMNFNYTPKNLLRKFNLKLGLTKRRNYDLVFFAGKNTFQRARKLSNLQEKIHLIDYDNYLKFKKSKKRNFCVFLDQAYTCHSDDLLSGNKKKIHMNYYKSLDTFFSKIEKKFKLKVKIALHPKNYLSKKYFFGRSSYMGNTAKLVSQSQFVFCHTSLSISYAVLNFKPLIFLNSKVFNDYSENGEDVRIAKILSNYLGCEFLNIDEFSVKNNLNLTVNKTLYKKYKYNYIIAKDKEGITSRDIFIKKLKNLTLR